MLKRIIYLIFIWLLPVCLSSCKDDLIDVTSEIPEGESEVEATLYFNPITAASLGTSSRAAGNAIKDIESLCVLLYDTNGNFLKSFYGTKDDEGTFASLIINQRGNTDRPSDDKNISAEEQTPKASVKFNVDNGVYKIYAVANMGDVATDVKYKDAIQTEKGLKGIKLQWQNDEKGASVVKNNQMFGYFCTDGSAHGFDAPEVKVNKKVNLFCWLRRAASKVTVAFDGTNLEEGVRIHLKSIKIKHIPKECYLGQQNTPGYTGYGGKAKDGAKPENELYEDGEVFYYCKPDNDDDKNFANWPRVSPGKSTYGLLSPQQEAENKDDQRLPISDYHTEDTPALYFYENLQGNDLDWPGKKLKDKRQDSDKDGTLDAPGLPSDGTYKLKDEVPFGTYIEVEAYYDARMSKQPSEGKIIYRFMLGKDVLKNYDAERNYHYKLTLMFNGYANDVDWHIEYIEKKDIIAPNPYYISYLYNQEAVLPIRLIGKDFEGLQLKAEIIENNWYPKVEAGDDFTFADLTRVYPTYSKDKQALWNGFLSLAQIKDKIIAPEDGGGFYHDKNQIDRNKIEWEKIPENAIRYMDLQAGIYDQDNKYGGYTVEKGKDGIVVQMPFYTRPKQLVPSTGYTGNNPYVAYQREAKVKLSLVYKDTGALYYKDGQEVSQEVVIKQVRRCVNPKGVWRSWDNNEDFHVVMKILPNESAEAFETYNSDGAWRAKIEIGEEFFALEDAGTDGYVHGHIDTPMDFKIKFKSTCDNETEVRCGIVYVEYNNYTCHHRIFLRQGYAPLILNDEGIKWHTCNMYSETEETASPLEEGSMFKFANWKQAILASNNKKYGFQKSPVDGLYLANDNTKTPVKWRDIAAYKTTTGAGKFSETTVTNVIGASEKVKVRVATVADYNRLRIAEDREFGYGVLYGDGATETLSNLNEVYGYVRNEENPNSIRSTYGMRGCFVYNTKNGNNLFFPIGATGYGRRKTERSWYDSGLGNVTEGALQYAWRSKRYSTYADKYGWSSLQYRPLFEDIYMRPGAVYWCKDEKYDDGIKTNKSFLDINYFTFDFNTSTDEPLAGATSSACFIRCVEDVSSD